ncbi:5-methyltetrahydropteroyltriglutamate--homocysteine S-methyltransferase [Bacillus sp. 1P06AnD]|uniref:5-methyltetrahydropteroyltriglutamate-- homocysteine S-methyltransferase n=1 Tax=Bacillus sp. 1P06AnD TaxID=3132208 RepID=UPI0039A16724
MSNTFKQAVKRDQAPFRADHVGSLLRPHSVKEARLQFQNGDITIEQLRSIEDVEIKKVVEKQKQLGFKAVTDGELRRSWWHFDFLAGLEGVEKVQTNKGYAFSGVQTKAEAIEINGRIGFSEAHPMLEDFRYLKSVAGEHIAKFTIPSPAMLHLVAVVRNEQYEPLDMYKENEDLLQDIIQAYQKAIQAFYDAGCRYLQLDDTSWGGLSSKETRKKYSDRGIDPVQLAKEYVRLINESIKDRPADMIITMHICRGNFRSTWLTSGGYDPVAEELFANAEVDGFFLEYDNDRSGDFKPLRYIKGQQVVLGLITSKTGELENREGILKRIEEAAEYVDMNQLCVSPQCGFSSTEEGNIITEEEQWKKLELVVSIADEVWK